MNFFGFNNFNMFGGCNPFASFNPFMFSGCGCNNPFTSIYSNPLGINFGMNLFQTGMPAYTYANNFSMPTFGGFSSYPSIFGNDYTMSTMGNFTMPMLNSFAMPQFTMPMLNSFAMPQFTMPSLNFGNLFSFPSINSTNSTSSNSTSSTSNTSKTQKTSTTTVSDTDNTPINDTGKLDKHFLRKVKKVAKKLNCDYKDLLALINSESGFNPKAKCGSYVGLIQFGDAAIEELRTKCGCKGLTKDKILNMSRIQQLDLVEKLLMYVKKWKFSPNARLSAGDLYAMIFAPGRADRDVLYSKGEKGYNSVNAKMDYNNDGKITKSEMSRRIREKSVNESIFA